MLIKDDFIKGLVPLFIYYSSDANLDHEMISLILKCMANFSLIEQGVEHLVEEKVVQAFKDYFDKYKDDHDNQNQLIFSTMSNLTYN